MRTAVGHSVPVAVYLGLILIPVVLALDRLVFVTGSNPIEAIFRLDEHPLALEAVQFTFIQATLSALLTLAIGLPIAWWLGRYEWKHIGLIRAALTLPFVTPTVVAAMGFLALINQGGILAYIGIDLRNETGFIGSLSASLGIENTGHIIALLLAHAWFNLALVIRFVEPKIATLPPRYEDAFRMLPVGTSPLERLRRFWWPMLRTSILSAFVFTFIFSFTSFALVRWLAPEYWTIESLMAIEGGAAGIPGYREDVSLLVLGGATLQGIVLLTALGIAGKWQQKQSYEIELVSEHYARKTIGKPNLLQRFGMFSACTFALAPLFLMALASVRIRDRTSDSYRWSTEAWRYAFDGNLTYASVPEALMNSLFYAIGCLLVACILGFFVAQTIHSLEERNKPKLAQTIDVLSMLPLALSGVMVGLGVLLGILKVWPALFSWYALPILPHAMLTTPFVVRILLPAMREIDSDYEEAGKILGYNQYQRFFRI
ncbi:MAG: ABC transporter permease, partial [Candidatus Poseidoniaceae archaeon]